MLNVINQITQIVSELQNMVFMLSQTEIFKNGYLELCKKSVPGRGFFFFFTVHTSKTSLLLNMDIKCPYIEFYRVDKTSYNNLSEWAKPPTVFVQSGQNPLCYFFRVEKTPQLSQFRVNKTPFSPCSEWTNPPHCFFFFFKVDQTI